MRLSLLAVLLVGCSAAQVKQDETAAQVITCDACIVGCVGCGVPQTVEQRATCAVCLVSCGIVQASRDGGAP